jgi:tRNA(Ile)-lysidine synthetase-like protein
MNLRESQVPPSVSLETLVQKFWGQPELPQWLDGVTRLGVGVSGGGDSVALLYLLTGLPELRPAWAPEIVAFHVNHGLRGAQADADETLVFQLARVLRVPVHVRRLDPERIRAHARRNGSLEDAARSARLNALRGLADRSHCQAVALAHHQDDLAETFLMRLLRGSGLRGLGGFAPETQILGLRLVRPLIHWSRSELQQVAQLAGLEWAEDAMNADPTFLRCRVRHEILPCLERQTDHPPAARMLAQTARRLERENRALSAYIEHLYRTHRVERTDPRRSGLPVALLCQEPEAVFAPYLLRLLLARLIETPFPPEEQRILELENFVRTARPGSLMQTARNIVVWYSPEGILWAWQKPSRNIPRDEQLRIFQKP